MANEAKNPNLSYAVSGGFVGGGKYFATPAWSVNSKTNPLAPVQSPSATAGLAEIMPVTATTPTLAPTAVVG